MNSWMYFLAPLLATVSIVANPVAIAQQMKKTEPMIIQEQGSFAVGGTVAHTPGIYNNNAPTAEGQSFHATVHLPRIQTATGTGR